MYLSEKFTQWKMYASGCFWSFFLFFNFIPFKISVFLVKKTRLYMFLKMRFTFPPSPKIEIKKRTQVRKIRNIKITRKQFSSIYNSKYISKTISLDNGIKQDMAKKILLRDCVVIQKIWFNELRNYSQKLCLCPPQKWAKMQPPL